MRDRAVTRPARSPGGFRRRVEIGARMLHIVVEGKSNDIAYYGKIADHSSVLRHQYTIIPVKTLKGSGGKKSVLEHFEYMRTNGYLVQKVSAGNKVTVFMVDRDAERIFGGTVMHPHVEYTTGYDVEADIMTNAVAAGAISTAVGVSPNQGRSAALALIDWRSDAATVWREWITLCCISHRLGLNCSATFRSFPQINDKVVGPVKKLELLKIRREIFEKSSLSISQFECVENLIARRVERIYVGGFGYLLVKGKWMPKYLAARLSVYFGESYSAAKIETQLMTNFLSAVDPSQPWARRYLECFEMCFIEQRVGE